MEERVLLRVMVILFMAFSPVSVAGSGEGRVVVLMVHSDSGSGTVMFETESNAD